MGWMRRVTDLSLIPAMRKGKWDMKEVLNHTKHIEATLNRLMDILFTEDEFNAICALKEDAASLFSSKSAWIRTSSPLQIPRNSPTLADVCLPLSFFQGRRFIFNSPTYSFGGTY